MLAFHIQGTGKISQQVREENPKKNPEGDQFGPYKKRTNIIVLVFLSQYKCDCFFDPCIIVFVIFDPYII